MSLYVEEIRTQGIYMCKKDNWELKAQNIKQGVGVSRV